MVAVNWYYIGVLLFYSVCFVHSKDTFNRNKRAVTCDQKFTDIVSGHTACLSRSSNYISGEFNEADIPTIVNRHNAVRAEVSPSATNMLKMSWDDEIAKIAQRWAENCEWNHDNRYRRYDFGRYSLGQNLAYHTGSSDWETGMQGWIGEKSDYDYQINGSPTNAVVGHYTQMVWATSHKIGCGYAQCNFGHYFVCNYGPSGNLNGVKPYTSGTTCADCQTCSGGLCDCGDKTCFNDGTLSTSTCTCSCVDNASFYIAEHCGLNCTDIESKEVAYKCKGGYDVSGCGVYSNVPVECPNMCGWCPAAEYKSTPTSTANYITVSYFYITVSLLLSFIFF
ncbi:Cysteine-rich secretory protein 2 [Mactra antiquata]